MSDKTELEVLQERATQMGIKFHPNTGLDKLKKKIELKLANDTKADEIDVETDDSEEVETKTENKVETKEEETKEDKPKIKETDISKVEMPVETVSERNTRLRKEAAKLVRVRVTCMNPDKRKWPGEVFTVSNSVVGTHKKFVPYNSDAPYHVPMIIYKHMKEKKCQIIAPVKQSNGETVTKGRIINELAIEVLDPLTPAELEELARKQALGKNIDE